MSFYKLEKVSWVHKWYNFQTDGLFKKHHFWHNDVIWLNLQESNTPLWKWWNLCQGHSNWCCEYPKVCLSSRMFFIWQLCRSPTDIASLLFVLGTCSDGASVLSTEGLWRTVGKGAYWWCGKYSQVSLDCLL